MRGVFVHIRGTENIHLQFMNKDLLRSRAAAAFHRLRCHISVLLSLIIIYLNTNVNISPGFHLIPSLDLDLPRAVWVN